MVFHSLCMLCADPNRGSPLVLHGHRVRRSNCDIASASAVVLDTALTVECDGSLKIGHNGPPDTRVGITLSM